MPVLAELVCADVVAGRAVDPMHFLVGAGTLADVGFQYVHGEDLLRLIISFGLLLQNTRNHSDTPLRGMVPFCGLSAENHGHAFGDHFGDDGGHRFPPDLLCTELGEQ